LQEKKKGVPLHPLSRKRLKQTKEFIERLQKQTKVVQERIGIFVIEYIYSGKRKIRTVNEELKGEIRLITEVRPRK